MFYKKIIFILTIFLFYQTPIFSKSNSFNDFQSKNLSNYFSAIVAFENKDNSKALDYFNYSKNLINRHDPYFKKYIYSLVLENKIIQAINLVKNYRDKNNSNFFEAQLLLIIDSLKNEDFDIAFYDLIKLRKFAELDRLDSVIISSLEQYIFLFKENKFLDTNKNFGKLSIISEAFQRCYLNDPNTEIYFSSLVNGVDADYSRYIFFYLSYLIENKLTKNVNEIIKNIEYLDSSLLLSQAKNWIERGQKEKLTKVFSCQEPSHLISEFLFLVSNLYSSQDQFEKSNFYLSLSNFLNPKFIFNLSLVAENQYLNGEYKKLKKTLKNFKDDDYFYYWYRIKKEAQIIAKQKSKKESLQYITLQFEKIKNPNKKLLYDLANFYRNSKEYKKAIKYYTLIIDTLDDSSEIKTDLLYRRGGSYERIGDYEKADKDLIHSLKIYPDDAYVLNYLAYSWLERNYKIDEAIRMLEKAYSFESNDPYIIDSIGWAYYLIDDYIKAEKLLKRAVELMPDDPIVNDHYGDILWKLNRKIQARYFWSSVLKMEDAEKELIQNIEMKMIKGLKKS